MTYVPAQYICACAHKMRVGSKGSGTLPLARAHSSCVDMGRRIPAPAVAEHLQVRMPLRAQLVLSNGSVERWREEKAVPSEHGACCLNRAAPQPAGCGKIGGQTGNSQRTGTLARERCARVHADGSLVGGRACVHVRGQDWLALPELIRSTTSCCSARPRNRFISKTPVRITIDASPVDRRCKEEVMRRTGTQPFHRLPDFRNENRANSMPQCWPYRDAWPVRGRQRRWLGGRIQLNELSDCVGVDEGYITETKAPQGKLKVHSASSSPEAA